MRDMLQVLVAIIGKEIDRGVFCITDGPYTIISEYFPLISFTGLSVRSVTRLGMTWTWKVSKTKSKFAGRAKGEPRKRPSSFFI